MGDSKQKITEIVALLKPGVIFNTRFEKGCEVVSVPNEFGNFDGLDSERVLVEFSVAMVTEVREQVLPLLGYSTTIDLAIPADLFNTDGLARILTHGTRYSGAWRIKALGPEQQVYGTINTEQDERPDAAVGTTRAWVNDACTRTGLKIVHFENLNSQYPPDQAPYFALARFVIADKDWT